MVKEIWEHVLFRKGELVQIESGSERVSSLCGQTERVRSAIDQRDLCGES
jgi:hypothetical protein